MTVASYWPQPSLILNYYRRSLESLDLLKRHVLAALVDGQVNDTTLTASFRSMTQAEVDSSIGQLRDELHHAVVLMLVAAFEATLQTDLRARLSRKGKDAASRRFRKLWHSRHKRRGADEWVRIEAILDVWKSFIGKAEIIGDFKQLVMFRHWLAHGRYWVQKSGLSNDFDPFDAWERGKALFDILPGFAPLPQSH
ncbi:MAG: hypothetical protein B7Z73_03180 [Planctomycetia bacterium 21-64-5]|nr:MAG: hypothetical protein B7Z73_03180 [Planctomycetia bacterium 21-64-5]HQU41286.1 hypothetical protein [Pirellulales bacterium]